MMINVAYVKTSWWLCGSCSKLSSSETLLNSLTHAHNENILRGFLETNISMFLEIISKYLQSSIFNLYQYIYFTNNIHLTQRT